MRTITIRIERSGPAEDYPLSPATQYIGSFDNQPASTITVDFDQATYTQQKELLRYFNATPAQRITALEFFGTGIKQLLESIKQLSIEIGQVSGPVHLRLLVEAREIAQLPFELCRNLQGITGDSMIGMLLNQTRLFTMTREIRQPGHINLKWPVVPRILFAAASPSQSVPFTQHFEVLRDVVKALVSPDATMSEPIPDIAEKLSVLKQASLKSINESIKEGIKQGRPFTHIHILAHGAKDTGGFYGDEFKLALHDDDDLKKTALASGNDLAMKMLERDGDKLVQPAIVSLTVCDSANVNNLTLPSGSFAHQLHANGVPCVFASQFPLTVNGSMKLVKVLYEKLLLEGEDPRKALYDTRNELYDKDNHDWASLIAYTRFPEDINEQLKDYRLNVYLESLKTSNTWSDHIILHKNGIDQEKMESAFTNISSRLDNSINSLERLFKEWESNNVNENRFAEHSGLMGSAYKRKAEHLFRLANFYREKAMEEKASAEEQKSKEALSRARECYNIGFTTVKQNHWTGIQYLSLTAITKGRLSGSKERDNLVVIRTMAEGHDNAAKDPMTRLWAWGTLIELYLLKPLSVPAEEFEEEKEECLSKAEVLAEKMGKAPVDFAFDPRAPKEEIRFALSSTLRQIDRYIWWWPVMYRETFKPEIKEMAEAIKKILKDQ